MKEKYEVITYDYYFYYGDEYLKADECYSGYYGSSYCYIGDKKYSNVSFEKIESGSVIKEIDLTWVYFFAGIYAFFVIIGCIIGLIRD